MYNLAVVIVPPVVRAPQLENPCTKLDSVRWCRSQSGSVYSTPTFTSCCFYFFLTSSINRLQRIQNSLARAVMPFVKRYDHITPALRKLHWLPIRQRITFKIATLTFKTLHYSQPSYLLDLITHHTPTRILRSASQHLLVVPRINSQTGRRSFSFAAPTIWNSLPLSLRSTSSLTTFRVSLKTHLFPT
jgi:hypothetical protein